MGLGLIQMGEFEWANKFRLILPPLGKMMHKKCNTTKAGLGSTCKCNATAAHKAGTSIALDGSPFVLFLIVNILTFVFTNSILLVLVPAGHNSTPFFVPNSTAGVVILICSFLTITQAPDWTLVLLLLRV